MSAYDSLYTWVKKKFDISKCTDKHPVMTFWFTDRRPVQSLSLTCTVWGEPAPEVTWFKNEQEVASTEHTKITFDGGKFASLVINKVTTDDSGKYSINVRNKYGGEFVEITVSVYRHGEQIPEAKMGQPKTATPMATPAATPAPPKSPAPPSKTPTPVPSKSQTPAPSMKSPTPGVTPASTPAPKTPTPAPKSPTPSLKSPTPAPKSPTPVPKSPTPSRSVKSPTPPRSIKSPTPPRK